MIYRFEEYELDSDRFELRLAGSVRKVEPQVFSLLELLISNHARLVTKDEINLHVWGGRVVSEAVVNSRIRVARQAVGDDGKDQRLIRTVHGRGFRFVGDVATTSTADVQTAELSNLAGDCERPCEDVSDGRPSVAVLPLQVLTPDERYGTLGDAVSQEVILELSRLHWLFVIARGSSFRFREPGVDLSSVGRVLGARYILTGTIAFHDRTSIVTVELAHASDCRVVWADRFECPVHDLLQLRLLISAQVVAAIETRIQMAEAERAARLPTENLDAWSAYHRGLWHMYRFNRHDNEIATRMFDRAIAADSSFARAYAGLSFTHFQNAFVGYSSDFAGQCDQTRRFAEKSLEMDPLDPFVNLTMGRSHWLAGSLSSSIPWLDRCVDLSPNYAFALYNRALLDAIMGEGEQSQGNVSKAIALSPIDPLSYAMLATRALSHIVRGDYETAASWAHRATMAPNAHVHIYVIAAIAHELAGHRDRARHYIAHLSHTDRTYNGDEFFRAFPFQDDKTRAIAQAALKKLEV